jgi:hypothetical protein
MIFLNYHLIIYFIVNKKYNISDEEYNFCNNAWKYNNMKKSKDFLSCVMIEMYYHLS